MMKNKFQFLATLTMILAVSLGCGLISRTTSGPEDRNSNKTLTDKAVDKTVGQSKIGVPECDEVMDAIELELNNSDDNFITKAVKATFLNRIKDSIAESVKESKGDTVELAKTCREFKTQFEKYKAEEGSKKE
ncbi:MAG: hypothetical protein ABIU09_02505 [Pyrinomonadaceae bacterium]